MEVTGGSRVLREFGEHRVTLDALQYALLGGCIQKSQESSKATDEGPVGSST